MINPQIEKSPGGRGFNVDHEAVDRHVARGLGDKAALRFLASDGRTCELTYRALCAAANRCANVLRGLGVGKQFVVGLKEHLGVEVPEADYARIRTLNGCRTYLRDHEA